MTESANDGQHVTLGINLGSYQTTLASSRGDKTVTRSVLGYPKDLVAIRTLSKTQVFGQEAIDHKSALALYYPFKDNLSNEGKQDYMSAFELIRFISASATAGHNGDVFAVISTPARISGNGKRYLKDIAGRLFTRYLLLPEPFLAAYQLQNLNNILLIDIGASSVDICILKGAVPNTQDIITLPLAGDYVDQSLETLISQQHPDAVITRDLARQIKEKWGFAGEAEAPVEVELRSGGKPQRYELSREIRTASESIIPDIIEQLVRLFKSYPPEDLETVLQNIYLCGGGARIKNIDRLIAAKLAEYGHVSVRRVEDGQFIGANGALRLAMDLPPDSWDEFTTN